MRLIIIIIDSSIMEWSPVTREQAAQLIEHYWKIMISYTLEVL